MTLEVVQPFHVRYYHYTIIQPFHVGYYHYTIIQPFHVGYYHYTIIQPFHVGYYHYTIIQPFHVGVLPLHNHTAVSCQVLPLHNHTAVHVRYCHYTHNRSMSGTTITHKPFRVRYIFVKGLLATCLSRSAGNQKVWRSNALTFCPHLFCLTVCFVVSTWYNRRHGCKIYILFCC